jgi:uncharacterized membrane protein YjdF
MGILLAELTLNAPDGIRETLGLAFACAVTLLAGRRAIGAGWAVMTAAMSLLAFAIIGNIAIPLAAAIVSVGLLVRSRATSEPLQRPLGPYFVQLVLVLGGLSAYTLARFVVESDEPPAFGNADGIIDFERSLGLYFEPGFQAWVMESEVATRTVNWVYSFGFLAITAAALLWLWVVDMPHYRVLRNALGISALLAIPTIALYPLAPPRLAPGAELIDTIAVFGREHAFANEYAAMPSLHVGWMAAAGVVLGRSIGGRRGWMLALSMGPLMLLTVIATGNHYWLDGVVGVLFTVGPALVLTGDLAVRNVARASTTARAIPRFVWDAGLRTWMTLGDNRRALFSFLALGGLLAYLLIAQRLTPGFTDFWGYLAGQVAVFLVLLVAGEVVFEKQGGLSWMTHVVAAVCAYADVLGTDGNLYAMIDEYDKVTHFAGTAALTAGLYDCLRAARLRGWISLAASDRLMLTIAVGVAMGIGWEVYELMGDKVFQTARVNGRWDTANDIFSDALGAVSVALLLWAHEIGRINIGVAGPREAEAGVSQRQR